jgi:hypothetical protein
MSDLFDTRYKVPPGSVKVETVQTPSQNALKYLRIGQYGYTKYGHCAYGANYGYYGYSHYGDASYH